MRYRVTHRSAAARPGLTQVLGHMRIFAALIGITALTACSSMGRHQLPGAVPGPLISQVCSSVASLKANDQPCMGRTIQIRAYLISTRHGSYLVDTPEGRNILTVEFPESDSDRKSTSVLLEKLARANIGHPYAQLYGAFEGRLVVKSPKEGPVFEIYSEVQ
jgi:hypothetical protein